ncbi:signal peptidase I [Streptomyces sp. NPDC005803]|uniref:signal peptidase I n=1 Tax=Streptomyces sp. NPDC005803 TaxID=3154297 RepID=UPI003403C58E
MPQRGTAARLRDVAWLLAPLGLAILAGAAVYAVTHYQVVTVSGDSMRPTYRPGGRLLIEQVDANEIRRGDVVLIAPPERYMAAPVVRRVIGIGGDHVVGVGNRVTVNGKPLDEPYVKDADENVTARAYDVMVPDGRLFVLGDHRANANDSRYHLGEQSGSFAVTGVRGRTRENSGIPAVLLVSGGAGVALILGGIGGYAARRRARRLLPPPHQAWSSALSG